MADIKERLAQRIAASEKVLAKAAGECCSEESAKCPTQLVGDAADVQVENNLPEGVTVPGEKGMSDSGLTPEDKGTDIGHVETNGPGVPENAEVVDIIASAQEFSKKASALIEAAQAILDTPDSEFGGVAKKASAEITEQDVQQFIVKRANAGDPVAQGIITYVSMLNKVADGVPAEDVVEGAELEAGLAQVQEQVAAALKEEHPELSDEEAAEIAAQATAAAAQDAGAGVEGEDASAMADELVAETAAQIKAQVPGISDEEAGVLAVKAVADVIEGNLPKAASEEEKPEDVVEEEVVAEAPTEEAAAAEATEAVEGAEAGVDEAKVSEEVGNLIMGLAEEIKAQDPSISDEEAINGAADAVIDAVETAGVQQQVGAVDEAGAPVVDDATAQAMVDELGKTASANPLRDALTPVVNNLLGLSPDAFAARLGVK